MPPDAFSGLQIAQKYRYGWVPGPLVGFEGPRRSGEGKDEGE